jgi:hypothetical protein
VTDIGYEIHGVEYNLDGVLFAFFGSKSIVKKDEIFSALG